MKSDVPGGGMCGEETFAYRGFLFWCVWYFHILLPFEGTGSAGGRVGALSSVGCCDWLSFIESRPAYATTGTPHNL